MSIRHLPGQDNRVETGTVQFGDDWPGVFIRGDNAGAMAMTLKSYLDSQKDVHPLTMSNLRGLQGLLESCNVKGGDAN